MTILFTIFSCSPRISRIFVGVADKEFPESLKNSSPDFIRGWKDGCEVGSSGGSNTFYKMFYRSNAIDGFKFSGNTDYRDAWVNAFWYCYRNMFVINLQFTVRFLEVIANESKIIFINYFFNFS